MTEFCLLSDANSRTIVSRIENITGSSILNDNRAFVRCVC